MQILYQWLQLAKQAEAQQLLDEFLSLSFTPKEYAQLEKRYLLLEALVSQQMPQRELAKTLEVSIAKITRGSNALKPISPKLKRLLQNFFTHHHEGKNNAKNP